jgi:hypothetical protein
MQKKNSTKKQNSNLKTTTKQNSNLKTTTKQNSIRTKENKTKFHFQQEKNKIPFSTRKKQNSIFNKKKNKIPFSTRKKTKFHPQKQIK